MSVASRLAPPPTKGHFSVARLDRFWYAVAFSDSLGRRPRAVRLLGAPLVLFRDAAGAPHALLDRCPHRNVPLSMGRCTREGRLECAYHGWQFDGGGVCRRVPGLLESAAPRERRVPAHATLERAGLIWVWGAADEEPTSEPATPRLDGAPGYTTVRREVLAPATLHATVENALDVPHTAFLHSGLFRGGGARPNEIRAVVRRGRDRVEVEYLGEPRPPGLAARLLSPSGGTVEHWDRFLLPSVAEVEYRLGSENHFLVTSYCTPEDDFSTRLFAVVSFRTRLPGALLRLFLEPVARRIFAQDAAMLARQTETVRRFGGEQYQSTELDLLGPHVWRLLRAAERGEPLEEGATVEREVRFLA